jgi:phosphate uptake regulator
VYRRTFTSELEANWKRINRAVDKDNQHSHVALTILFRFNAAASRNVRQAEEAITKQYGSVLYLAAKLLSRQTSVLTFESLRLTLCTISFSIQKFCVLPTMHLCVLSGSQSKQRLFRYIALTSQYL